MVKYGRLWQSVVLYNYNKIFEIIPTETLVYENQQKYYDVIEISRKLNSSTPFIEFMLEMILQTIDILNIQLEQLYTVKEEYLEQLNKTEKEILNIIITKLNINNQFTVEIIHELTNKANSSLRNYLKKFVDKDILIAEGKNKGRTYLINKNIFKYDK